MCVDDRHNKPFMPYFDEDSIDKTLNDMIKESEYCSKAYVPK